MTIKIGGIIPSSLVNGEGIRSVLFLTGCSHGCEKCHAGSLTNYKTGINHSINDIISILKKNEIINKKRVTLSGGDPFYQAEAVLKLTTELKKAGYNIWCYTGYTIEEILNSNNKTFIDLLKTIDTLIDGKFNYNLTEDAPKYTGSSNQRIICTKDYLNIS